MTLQTRSAVPPPTRLRNRQGGAALYVALIMLVLLALIGVIGMQVAGMQERMASNYQAVNIAFQHAEGLVREVECTLEGRPGCAVALDVDLNCSLPFDAGAWATDQGLATSPAINVRRIDSCIGISDATVGHAPVREIDAVYQITVYASDAVTDGAVTRPASSAAVIETIYKH